MRVARQGSRSAEEDVVPLQLLGWQGELPVGSIAGLGPLEACSCMCWAVPIQEGPCLGKLTSSAHCHLHILPQPKGS